MHATDNSRTPVPGSSPDYVRGSGPDHVRHAAEGGLHVIVPGNCISDVIGTYWIPVLGITFRK